MCFFAAHQLVRTVTAEELVTIHSLGFRGEALSSIAAVTRNRVISKTEEGQSGIKYVIEGGKETGIGRDRSSQRNDFSYSSVIL